jgi:uncharacterized protein YfaP (DUF2135 family)
MKKSILTISICVFLFTNFYRCNKDETTQPAEQEKQLTDVERNSIELTHLKVATSADSILLAEKPMQGFEKLLPALKNEPDIEHAWLTNDALYIKYKKGGLASWYIPRADFKPPYLPKANLNFGQYRKTNSDTLVGNNKVCLINQQEADESQNSSRDIINRLEAIFSQNNFEVDIKSSGDFNMEFFSNELSKYGTIYCITHGSYDSTNIWISLGQQADISLLTQQRYQDWLNSQISVMTVNEIRNGVSVAVQYLAVSNLFIDNKYENADWPNSLIYLSAGQFFKSWNFAEALHSKGAGVIVGWDESNCSGKYIGEHLLNLMLGGLTLFEAYEALPEESRVDNCASDAGANLTFYPRSNKTMQLMERPAMLPEIVISNPLDGSLLNTQDDRVIEVRGQIMGVNNVLYSTLKVNDNTILLQTAADLTFTQRMVLNQGENKIKLVCVAVLDNNESVTLSRVINVRGDFPPLDLFTFLTWNTNGTDVDFHLLGPNSISLNDLWDHTQACYYWQYYNNQFRIANNLPRLPTPWGGWLDVDDTNNRGPEIITIPQLQVPGVYRLFVHYYADNTVGPTQAFVYVIANCNVEEFGPITLNTSYVQNTFNNINFWGDCFEVCRITLPDGQITPVNQFHTIPFVFPIQNAALTGFIGKQNLTFYP